RRNTVISGDSFVCGYDWRLFESPNCEFGSIGHSELSEDPIQILFYRPFGEVQFEGDFLVQFGLRDQVHYLPFPKAQLRIQRFFEFRSATTRADPVASVASKLFSAAKAASQGVGDKQFHSHLDALFDENPKSESGPKWAESHRFWEICLA